MTTNRLIIKLLTTRDGNLILELVNSDGYIKFIGNKNITSTVEAIAYIKKIKVNINISYWVVILKETQDKIGIVTFIRRDYLEHPDIGFAFLPKFTKLGYAYEATIIILKALIRKYGLSHILATTVPQNTNSIKLLDKLGFTFEKELEIETSNVHIYGTSTDKLINVL